MKKILISFSLMPLILSLLVVISFMFVFVNGNETGDSNAAVNGLPECVKYEMVLAALDMQEKHKHPASVTLAQIIQESTGRYEGLSGLAYNYHNLFGIKAGSSWTGKTITMATGEQTSNGDSFTVRASFRSYDTWTESIEDRSRLLNNSSYYPISGVTDAKEFARCLKAWATDIDYAETLIGHMDKYNLYSYDTMTKEQFIAQSTVAADSVIDKALTKLGCKYVWGGGHSMEAVKNPNQSIFDCSSFVCWSFYQAGKDIGIQTTKQLINQGREVTKEEAMPGDIILFSADPNGKTPSHVGIYMGNNQMVHAPRTGDVVKIVNLSSYYQSRTLCYRRVI